MAIELNAARSSFQRLKRDISDVSNATIVEWMDWINKYLYAKVSILDPTRFLSSQTYNVTTTPSTQALPADFKNIDANQSGVFLVDSNGNDTEQLLPITGYGSGNTGYYIDGSNIVFTGSESQTYKLRYIPTQTALTDLGDYFTLDGTVSGAEIILERHMEYVVKALDVLYNLWDEEVGAESLADFRFVRAMAYILDDYKQAPLVYSTRDYSTDY